ncbi:hypothetical protein LTR29_017905 [Friedmanniomyces endolithicus]|nr:hypothetical protein LTR29_017905 [Friedmanniomyces endolithicus]
MATPELFRRTTNNPTKFEQERKNTVFKKAWEYKTGLSNNELNAQIAVLIQREGKWEVYLSQTQRDWPINFEAMPDCKMISSKDFLLPKEREKWVSGMDSDGEYDTTETYHEPFQRPHRTTKFTTPLQKRPRLVDDCSDGTILYTPSDDSDERPVRQKKGRVSVESAATTAQTSSELQLQLRGPAQTGIVAPGSFTLSRLDPPAPILRSSSSSRLCSLEGTLIEIGDQPTRAPSTPPTGPKRQLFPRHRASSIFNR